MKKAKKEKKAKKMRLGRVCINIGYVVDLDNPAMIQEAMDCLYEDVANSVKYNEECSLIKVVIDPKFKKSDIPDFLLDNKD